MFDKMASAHITAILPWPESRLERGLTCSSSEIPLPSGRNADSHPAAVYHFFGKGDHPPNGSACFIFGRFTPQTSARPFIVEAYRVVPIPGDPSQDDYVESLPFESAQVVLVGRVTGAQEIDKSFTIECSEHVIQERVSFSVRCSIPASKRFENLRVPTVGSYIQMVATLDDVDESGLLYTTLINIVYIPSSPSTSSSLAPPTPRTSSFWSRKRKRPETKDSVSKAPMDTSEDRATAASGIGAADEIADADVGKADDHVGNRGTVKTRGSRNKQ